jgi:O-antigen/teichoic acid export membrane protein
MTYRNLIDLPGSFGRAVAGTFFGNLVIQLLGVVTGILSARWLGPEGRGELATVFYYPTVFSQFGDLGLSQATVYEVSRKRSEEAWIAGAGFWTGVLLGASQLLIGTSVIPIIIPDDKTHLLPMIMWLMGFPLLLYCSEALLAVDQGAFRFGRYNVLRSVPSITYAIGIITVSIIGQVSVNVFAFLFLAGHVLIFVILAGFVWYSSVKGLPQWSRIKHMLKKGIGFHIPQVSLIALSQADMLMVISFMPSDQVGLYAVAFSVARAQWALAGALSQVAFVKVAAEMDQARAISLLLTQFRAAQLMYLVVATGFLLITPYLLLYAFGTQFVPATRTAFWLTVAVSTMGLTTILDLGFRALGHPGKATIANCAGLIAVLAGGLLVLPQGGIESMAVVRVMATLVTLVISSILLLSFRAAGIRDLWGINARTFLLITRDWGRRLAK